MAATIAQLENDPKSLTTGTPNDQDMHTLHVEHAVLLGLYTLLTLVNSWLSPRHQGRELVPVYNYLCALPKVLSPRRPAWAYPGSPLDRPRCRGLFPIAYLFLHRSLTEFLTGSEPLNGRVQEKPASSSLLS